MDEVDENVSRTSDPRSTSLWIVAIVLVVAGLVLTAAIALALGAVLDQLGRGDGPRSATRAPSVDDEPVHDGRDDRPLDPQDVILGTTPGAR